jgi:hypothetical protein
LGEERHAVAFAGAFGSGRRGDAVEWVVGGVAEEFARLEWAGEE